MTCKDVYGEMPGTKDYEDCLSYSGKYEYKRGGKLKNTKIKNPRYKGGGRITAKDYSAGGKYSNGGMLVGPSHEDGGIQAIVDGTEPIEVEGGEFVINKKTVDAVGENFLHKLNSTSTPYHDPENGFSEGELPSPSMYADGGKVSNRRNNMRGRRIPKRKIGGRARRTKPVTRGTLRMGGGGICGGQNQPPCRGYRKGGGLGRNISRRRSYAAGGNTLGIHASPRKQCRTIGSDRFSCRQTRGCNWNASESSCF